jgi:hypothetical protein
MQIARNLRNAQWDHDHAIAGPYDITDAPSGMERDPFGIAGAVARVIYISRPGNRTFSSNILSSNDLEGGVTVSTQVTPRVDRAVKPTSADRPAKKKFGLVLQGGGALGAYEVGAIKYLYESGMECAIVSGASSGAMNAATLAGAKGYPPDVLEELWGELMVDPPIPFLPRLIRRSWSMFGVPHMHTPRWDYWKILNWTYVAKTTPLARTLERRKREWNGQKVPGMQPLSAPSQTF